MSRKGGGRKDEKYNKIQVTENTFSFERGHQSFGSRIRLRKWHAHCMAGRESRDPTPVSTQIWWQVTRMAGGDPCGRDFPPEPMAGGNVALEADQRDENRERGTGDDAKLSPARTITNVQHESKY